MRKSLILEKSKRYNSIEFYIYIYIRTLFCEVTIKILQFQVCTINPHCQDIFFNKFSIPYS